MPHPPGILHKAPRLEQAQRVDSFEHKTSPLTARRWEALFEDRDGEQSVTVFMLGTAGLPQCHRALHMVSKEEVWVLLFLKANFKHY